MSSRLKSRITRRVLGRGVKDFLKKADSFLQRTKLLSYVGSALNLTQGNKNMERQTETSSTSTCGSSSLMRRSRRGNDCMTNITYKYIYLYIRLNDT